MLLKGKIVKYSRIYDNIFVILSHSGSVITNFILPITGHMVKIENFLNKTGEILIFCHVT